MEFSVTCIILGAKIFSSPSPRRHRRPHLTDVRDLRSAGQRIPFLIRYITSLTSKRQRLQVHLTAQITPLVSTEKTLIPSHAVFHFDSVPQKKTPLEAVVEGKSSIRSRKTAAAAATSSAADMDDSLSNADPNPERVSYPLSTEP